MEFAILGARIPTLRGFVEKNRITKVDEDLVLEVAKRDPTVRFLLKSGNLIRVKEEYFSPDTESLGWGVIINVL